MCPASLPPAIKPTEQKGRLKDTAASLTEPKGGSSSDFHQLMNV